VETTFGENKKRLKLKSGLDLSRFEDVFSLPEFLSPRPENVTFVKPSQSRAR
jgi:hypothetical protein